ncbi:hypothetical protein [Pelagicoccus albus]|uniref:Alkylhydroperoxidase AhpD family core domain-containing protein n=1 Tax=Pelagicoccus albus TaxID=415222 RepID=A0A7X1B4M3_9BACT|nr:hypothetical protein [Pelagicoccus albus]MBC2605462.1 hypothetical protein [Pelagicoccus albus]
MFSKIALSWINKFESHYNYDAEYLKVLLRRCPRGFRKFNKFMPMSKYRESLPADAYFVAFLTATQSEDCGSCVELVSKMALEASVPRQVVQSVLRGDGALPQDLRLVRNYALNVTSQMAVEPRLSSLCSAA